MSSGGRGITGKSNEEFVAWPYVDTLYDYIPFLKNPISRLPPEKLGTEVAIVGAGAAGMVAAYELLKIGLMPVVFEATNRIGGRCWSRPFTQNGFPVNAFAEMGAMRVPISSRVFYYYAENFGIYNPLKPTPFPDPGLVPTVLYYQNRAYRWDAGESNPKEFQKIQEDWEAFIGPLIEKIHYPWKKKNYAGVAQIWQEYIDAYKNKSFFQALNEGIPHWTTEDFNRFGALGIGTGGYGSLYHISFLEFLRIVVNQLEKKQQLIEGGIEKLIESFYTEQVKTSSGNESLRENGAVRLNTPVTRIVSGKNGNPVISFLDPVTKQECSREFPAVIVAISTRSMQITTGLTGYNDKGSELFSLSVKDAIKKLHLINSSKMFIRTGTKFWLDQDGKQNPKVPQNIQTDELVRGVYALDYPQIENGVILISYTWEDDSAKLPGLDAKERFRIFKEVLAGISPDFASRLEPVNEEIINIDWQAEKFYYGAFKLPYPGQESYTHAAYYQFLSVLSQGTDKGVYLAGDSISWSGGWVEGALHTGLNAACAVARRLGAELSTGSPLEQNPHLYRY